MVPWVEMSQLCTGDRRDSGSVTSRPPTLWRHRDFLKLWAGQSVSRLGSQVSLLALPLIAITVLRATTFEVGLLSAVEFAPFILVGLPAGVVADRVAKRPILIAADVGRLVALGSVPLVYELGALTIGQLYAVAFVSGVLTVFFDVAYQSYLPALVTTDELVEGNAKLTVSDSAATVAGPSIAGALVDVVGAALAVIADAVSFGISALSLVLVKRREPARGDTDTAARRGVRAEIGEGLGYVLRHPLLRPIACSTATSNLFSSMGGAVLTVYMVRRLGMSPGLIGLTLALGNIGFVVGALLTARVTTVTGVGRMIVVSMIISGTGGLLLPLATRSVSMPWLVAGSFLFSLGTPLYNINQVSLRQAITPFRLQGRMNASMRFMVWGTMPLGSIIGGVLGTAVGLRPTLLIAGGGGATAFLWLLFSPVPTVIEIPASGLQEVDHPAPGVGGVVGTVSGAIGIVDEPVLGVGIPHRGDVG